MLRLVTPLIIVSAAIAAVPAGATSAYTSAAVRDAAACARACADDGICMAWTFRAEGACELSAVAPNTAPTGASAFGLSARAPAFAQMRALTPIAEKPAPAPELPAPAVIAEPAPEPNMAAAPIASEDDLVLLGGPEDESLRLQFSRPR